MRFAAPLLVLLTVFAAGSALAQKTQVPKQQPSPQQQTVERSPYDTIGSPLFECGPNTVGQMGCQAGLRCKCRYMAYGDAMRGYPPGTYLWDCGVTHGSCLIIDILRETRPPDYGSGGGSGAIIVVPPGGR